MKINLSKIQSVTVNILTEMAKFADEIIEPMTYSGMKRRTSYIEGDPRRLANNYKSLERRGYVKINHKLDTVVLTNKGRIKLLENSTDNRVDGKWRMLSFDIPEELSSKRDQFRRSIKRIGYKLVQKSLWACPFARAEKVELIINELKLKKYVAYLRVDKTDIESHLINLFRDKI